MTGKEYKDRMAHVEEHYEQHLNTLLPDNLHRGDIVSTSRILGYADAMMATCATFLVIPLRNLHHLGNMTLAEFLDKNDTGLIMFFLGFLIVLTVWESLNVRSIVIKRMDDFLVLFTLLTMLASTILPFSLALKGHYPEENIPIVISCVILGIIEIFDIITLFYSMATPRVLHVAMHDWSPSDRHSFRNDLFLKSVINIILIIFGGLLCFVHYSASWVFLGLLILTPLMRKLLFFVRRRMASSNARMEKCRFFYYFTRGNIPKERVEAMSDAAIAIIACILILDITVEEFPEAETIKKHGLVNTLKHMSHEIYAFLLTYTAVSFLWYINHTVLHLFRTINVVLLYLQKIFLVFTCLAPLTSNMITMFLYTDNDCTKIAVRCGSLSVFISGFANFLMLCYGFWTKNKYLHDWAVGTSFSANVNQHLYCILKALNMPIWSLMCCLGTLGSAWAIKYVLFATIGGMLITFVILKFSFLNHVGREVYNPNNPMFHTEQKNIEGSVENKSMERTDDSEIRTDIKNEQCYSTV